MANVVWPTVFGPFATIDVPADPPNEHARIELTSPRRSAEWPRCSGARNRTVPQGTQGREFCA